MKKQIEIWEGKLEQTSSFTYNGLAIDEDTIDDIMDNITYYEGKKIRITVEVIE